MNQAVMRTLTNEEFARTFRDATKTDFESEIMERLVDEINGGYGEEEMAELQAERDQCAEDADKAWAEVEKKEEDLANYEEYVDALLEFVREKDPENELLDKDKWL